MLYVSWLLSVVSGSGDPLEKEVATTSKILALKIPWTGAWLVCGLWSYKKKIELPAGHYLFTIYWMNGFFIILAVVFCGPVSFAFLWGTYIGWKVRRICCFCHSLHSHHLSPSFPFCTQVMVLVMFQSKKQAWRDGTEESPWTDLLGLVFCTTPPWRGETFFTGTLLKLLSYKESPILNY